MGVYSIKDLENFTQIKAHTLRIWEQRYNLLDPARTETNIRFYTDEDLKKILNINLLYVGGLKISKIAELSEVEIQKLAGDILLDSTQDSSITVNSIIRQVIDFNETAILKILTDQLSTYSVEYIFSNLFIPLLKKIGELWQVNTVTVAHEHFLSNIIRRFLIIYTPEDEVSKQEKRIALLFLRENEYHELGLLFYNFYLRTHGFKTIYIGQSTPICDLQSLAESIKPDIIFTSLVAKIEKVEFQNFMKEVRRAFSKSTIYMGGFQLDIHKNIVPNYVNIVHSADHINLN